MFRERFFELPLFGETNNFSDNAEIIRAVPKLKWIVAILKHIQPHKLNSCCMNLYIEVNFTLQAYSGGDITIVQKVQQLVALANHRNQSKQLLNAKLTVMQKFTTLC